MVFHPWESNFTPRENGFTLFCQPNNVKLKIEENSFPGKRFTPYQTEPKHDMTRNEEAVGRGGRGYEAWFFVWLARASLCT